MEDLSQELSTITVSKPKLKETDASPDINAPNSYKSNNAKEIEVLNYAENFRRQFVHLYRDRKPLFLAPPNEFSIEVSKLLTWFLLDFWQIEPLSNFNYRKQ